VLTLTEPIWVAVGGRSTLVGGMLGALIVNGLKSWLTAAYPEIWLYVLGALFIAVTLFLPNGVVGLIAARRNKADDVPAAAEPEDEPLLVDDELTDKNLPSRA
jgi:urea transport system permease protein